MTELTDITKALIEGTWRIPETSGQGDQETMRLCRQAREDLRKLMDDIAVETNCNRLDHETAKELTFAIQKAIKVIGDCIRDLKARQSAS